MKHKNIVMIRWSLLYTIVMVGFLITSMLDVGLIYGIILMGIWLIISIITVGLYISESRKLKKTENIIKVDVK